MVTVGGVDSVQFMSVVGEQLEGQYPSLSVRLQERAA